MAPVSYTMGRRRQPSATVRPTGYRAPPAAYVGYSPPPRQQVGTPPLQTPPVQPQPQPKPQPKPKPPPTPPLDPNKTPNPIPFDPMYAYTVAGYNKQRQQAATQYTGQIGQLQSRYGIQQQGTQLVVDPTNPFSLAAGLQRSYQQASRGNTNSYAARGQLYSGALQNQQDTTGLGYQQNVNNLLEGYQTGAGQLASGLYQQLSGLNDQQTGALNDALQRAIKAGIDPQIALGILLGGNKKPTGPPGKPGPGKPPGKTRGGVEPGHGTPYGKPGPDVSRSPGSTSYHAKPEGPPFSRSKPLEAPVRGKPDNTRFSYRNSRATRKQRSRGPLQERR